MTDGQNEQAEQQSLPSETSLDYLLYMQGHRLLDHNASRIPLLASDVARSIGTDPDTFLLPTYLHRELALSQPLAEAVQAELRLPPGQSLLSEDDEAFVREATLRKWAGEKTEDPLWYFIQQAGSSQLSTLSSLIDTHATETINHVQRGGQIMGVAPDPYSQELGFSAPLVVRMADGELRFAIIKPKDAAINTDESAGGSRTLEYRVVPQEQEETIQDFLDQHPKAAAYLIAMGCKEKQEQSIQQIEHTIDTIAEHKAKTAQETAMKLNAQFFRAFLSRLEEQVAHDHVVSLTDTYVDKNPNPNASGSYKRTFMISRDLEGHLVFAWEQRNPASKTGKGEPQKAIVAWDEQKATYQIGEKNTQGQIRWSETVPSHLWSLGQFLRTIQPFDTSMVAWEGSQDVQHIANSFEDAPTLNALLTMVNKADHMYTLAPVLFTASAVSPN